MRMFRFQFAGDDGNSAAGLDTKGSFAGARGAEKIILRFDRLNLFDPMWGSRKGCRLLREGAA